MDTGSNSILGVGVIAVLVGSAVLLAMVRYDLGPKGRLARSGQWLLATALGTGILAFAFKLMIIVAVTAMPDRLVAPLIAQPPLAKTKPSDDPLLGLLGPTRYVWASLEGDSTTTSGSGPVWQALPEVAPAPADNPGTPEKVALGERLFHDRNLSRDRSVACASCHDVRSGNGTDSLPTSIGINGQRGGRNAPTVWNAAFQAVLFWDGRAASLEEQAKGPPLNAIEMGMPSLQAVEARVREDPAYRDAFARAFGDDKPITIDRIAKAIAAYERTLITPDTPYDRFIRGDLKAMTPAQLRGMARFQALGCVLCHSGPNFSAASLFDTRAPVRIFPVYPTPYEERYGLTRDSGAAPSGSGRGVWRVPSLRNVALTAPYFHNGSVKELREAVRIMSTVQLGHTGHLLVWSDRNKVLVELDRPRVSEADIDDLVAFLNALSSDRLRARLEGRHG